MIFPLPLTPMEYYFWADDGPAYPSSFPIELVFSGKLHRDALTDALQTTIARHPLLAATVDDSGKWPEWVYCSGQLPYLDWNEADVPIEHPDGERIDLTRTTGLRVWVREGNEQTRVYLQFHHACTDGLGVQTFIEDLLVSYCLKIGAGHEYTHLRPLDSQQLRRRSMLNGVPGDWSRLASRLQRGWNTLNQWSRLLRRWPAVLASPRPSDTAGQSSRRVLDFVTHTVSAEQIRRLKSIASDNGVTANDLLLRDLFFAMQQWNVRHGQRSNRWLSINMPANERDASDRTMPAANRLSMAFLQRRGRQCENGPQLLRSIHEETESIKRWKLGRSFVRGLELASIFRGLIPWFLKRPRGYATICLSNVGRIFSRTPLPRKQKRLVCGGAVLERIAGVPPVRPFTRAAITIVAYANEMTINLRCDHRYFDDRQRRHFLAEYISVLERTIACGV